MRISSVRLQNFKRFTDLVIRDIPATAKLIVVVGQNGCGKSSLFDAFIIWYRRNADFGLSSDDLYYRKDAQQEFNWNQNVVISLHDAARPKKGSLYLRTAYRNDPDFQVSEFARQESPSETVRIDRTIENDRTVSQNYQRLVFETVTAMYDSSNDAKTVHTLREELIGEVRMSMQSVFGDLLLNSISDPYDSSTFSFEKGATKSYHYKNLSGGEKAAFDLLLDIHVKKKYFADAIYCIDEVETHLHTKIQGAILKELVSIVPDKSQLWVTTHSLGVLRAAQEMAAINPASVCVIDFDGVDSDVPCELVPSNLGRVSWEKLLSITLDDLSQRIAPKYIVVCEGSSVGNRRKNFDAEIYNRVLGVHDANILFISGGSSNQVGDTGFSIRGMLNPILPSTTIIALADRNDKSDEEVVESECKDVFVLSRRNLESFLFADDVIEALVKREQKQEQLEQALEIKRKAIEESVMRGNPDNDLKSTAGEIYIGLKKLLGLQHCGNTTEAFMRDTLAPLIVPGMASYDEMKTTIIDRIWNRSQ